MSHSHPLTLRDAARGQRNLDAIARAAGDGRYAELLPHLVRLLARSADPDLALNHLERVFGTPHGAAQLPALLANSARGLDGLLQLLAVSQFFADTFVTYPEAFDLIRAAPRRNPTTDELTAELKAVVDACTDDAGTLLAFRRFRHLHMLRIGANDILRERALEEVTRELARVADSSIKIALATAMKTVGKRFGLPTAGGVPARIAGFAFGKLGGDELNYSSDIDLMFVYDRDGETNKKSGAITNAEFYGRVVTELVRLLSSVTDRGFAYRVDLRLRPEGNAGPLARSLDSTVSYYDSRGRTWERQALIKLRPVAGDRDLRKEVMAAIEPFVYRKYFSFSEINEVKALKRKMEQHATRSGIDDTDVKTGRGGIRDVEYTVQFLQLLNGGDLPAVRQRNTLLALDALEIAGCLNPQETYLLSDAYRFLRRTEHRLQLLFDRQTHKLPTGVDDLRTLARRMGYGEAARHETRDAGQEKGERADPPALPAQRRSVIDELPETTLDARQLLIDPLDLFLKDFHDKTATNRAILDHLLHQTFAGDAGGSEPESDLILDPDADDTAVRAVLTKYPFRDLRAAHLNLNRLAQEAVPFLSHRRCRHFLASIAAPLLRAVSDTPDPDGTLNNLERVTASLGAKAVLYELFSVNPPSLKLYVDICASSPYLSGILTKNPGMIDELLDSLVLDQPRAGAEVTAELGELLRGASDIDPILHSFQDKELLRIGVQDLLGKTDIRTTTAELSDVADALLNAVFDLTEPGVRAKLGDPTGSYAVLGLGKLGGREISYHSDLDVVLVYTGEGTDAQHYYTTLAQKAINLASRPGPLGKLYEVDMRLRPTGKSGSLALSVDEFKRYFGCTAQVWERLALTRARVVRSEGEFAEQLMACVREAVVGKGESVPTTEVATMRARLEGSVNPRSLKRGRGGLADVEFAVQLLLLRHGQAFPDVLKANVWEALDALAAAGVLSEPHAAALRDGYSFLRFVEARLRIVTDRPLTEIPEATDDLAKLARRSGFASADAFLKELAAKRAAVRAAYELVLGGPGA